MNPIQVCPLAFEKIVNQEASALDACSPPVRHFAFSRSAYCVMSQHLRTVNICKNSEKTSTRIHQCLPKLEAKYNQRVVELAASSAPAKFLYLPYDILVNSMNYQALDPSDQEIFCCHNTGSGMVFEDSNSGERKPLLATEDWPSEITSTSSTLGTSDANLIARDISSRYAINAGFVANCIKIYLTGGNEGVVCHSTGSDRLDSTTTTGDNDKQALQQTTGTSSPLIVRPWKLNPLVKTTQEMQDAVKAVYADWSGVAQQQFPYIPDIDRNPQFEPPKIARLDDNSSLLVDLLLKCDPKQVARRLKEAQERDASTMGRFFSVAGQLMTAAQTEMKGVQIQTKENNASKANSPQKQHQTNDNAQLFGRPVNRVPAHYQPAHQYTFQPIGLVQNNGGAPTPRNNNGNTKSVNSKPKGLSTATKGNHQRQRKKAAASAGKSKSKHRKRQCLPKPVSARGS